MRRIGGEEAWALNTRRHGRSHHNFIAEQIDEWGKERRNTHYGILERLGGMGLDTHYGEAFKQLDLPSVLSFGAAAIRRRIHPFITRDKAMISLYQRAKGRGLAL